MYCIATSDPTLEGFVNLEKRSQKTYGEPLLAGSLQYHAATEFVTKAIEAAGTFDTTEVVKVMETKEFDTVYGKTPFGMAQVYGLKRQIFFPIPLGVIRKGQPVHLGLLCSASRV